MPIRSERSALPMLETPPPVAAEPRRAAMPASEVAEFGTDDLVLPNFHVWTLGCQMNMSDSEEMAGALLAAGCSEAGVIDLAYFGMVPEVVGRGLGSWLMKTAILTAWDQPGATKVTVNTCTLDHPRALALYQKNGFTPVRREDKSRILARDRDLTRIPE